MRAEFHLLNQPGFAPHAPDVSLEHGLCFLVDDRTDVGGQVGGIADAKLLHGAVDHVDDSIGNVFLQKQHAKRRAALAGALEGGHQYVARHLLRQRAGVHDHGVHAAGLGDEGIDRTVAAGQRLVDDLCHLSGAGETHAGDAGIGHQR